MINIVNYCIMSTRSTRTVKELHIYGGVNMAEIKHIEYGTTQGKKGQKLPRINLGFSTSNHDFLRSESRKRGMSISAFINYIVEEYQKSNT